MRTPIDRQTLGEQTAKGQPLATAYETGVVLCGKYRLEALLGEGGMGAVFRASNLSLDLPVAIKLIRAGLDRGPLRGRLLLEARSAAKLRHPAIVRVYDVGESELGDPFIVMEHLRGETLAQQLLDRGPLSATHAVQLLLPIIDALVLAHGRGIVHRDLKPDNLMIALEEQHIRPKILDFGVAKLTDPCDSQYKLTVAGTVVGSPEYMSPEQARGQDDVDESTDIWAMCVVLYEAVTGCTPFNAANYNALLRSIVEDEPKPLAEHALGDAELWQILARGLRKDRAQRYAKISELGYALAGWLIERGISEDACGSSLASNWFARGSHGTARAATTRHAPSKSLPELGEEANLGSGTARGPFSATIRPVSSGSVRSVGAAVAACALLGVLSFAPFRSPSAPMPSARAAALPTILATALAAPPLVSIAPIEPATAGKIEVRPVSSAHAAAKEKPVAATRVSRPIWSAPRASSALAPGAAPSAAPASAKLDRPLDLLAPY